MEKMQEQIVNLINNFKNRFTLEELEQAISLKAKVSKRVIEDYLEESLNFFVSEDEKTGEKLFTPRKIFFHNAEFLISPTPAEIKKGILFSGHRFIPFYSAELFPTESFKITTPNNTLIKTKNIKFKLEDLYHYYSMLGAEGIIDNLTADNPDNLGIVGNPNQKINVSIFDFSDFYKENNITSNSYLKFTVKDWETGKFTVSTIKKYKENEEEKHIWFEELESGLFKTFEKEGPFLEIPEQLALGFFNADNTILKNPPCSIDEFIKCNEKIQIKFYEDNTILWHKDNINNSTNNTENPISISQGTIESLDSILEELGLIISSTEIEAFIKDSLLSGNNSPTSIMNKIFPESSVTFKDKAQEAAFYNHFEELWEEIIIADNSEKEINNHLINHRKEILNNLESVYNQYYESGLYQKGNNENLSSEQNTLYENIQSIREILTLFNNATKDIDADELENLDKIIFNRLKKLNESLDSYISKIDN